MTSPLAATARWLDDRLSLAETGRKTLRKPFPGHWTFLIGEVALYSLIVLFATGTFLALFYKPSTRAVVYEGPYVPLQGHEVSAAFDSVMRLNFEVRAGLLMRQIHHWAALLFMASIVVHMFRVFFTGAFRRPRELMWISGLVLLVLGIGAGFTGYSLPDDVLSGTGLRIGYSALVSVPFLGPWLAFTGLGGEFPNPDVIARLHIFHVMLLPALLAAVVTAHLVILFRQRHTQHRGRGRTERNVVGKPLYRTQTLVSLSLFAFTVAVLGLLGGLFEINPVWVYGPWEPSVVFAPSQPDWYVGWLEGLLRLWPAWEWTILGVTIPQPFIPGVVIPGIIFTAAGAWPWIEARFITKDADEHNLLDRGRDVPLRTAIGVGAMAFLLVVFVAGSNDVLAARLGFALERFTTVLTWSALLLPLISGTIAYRWCVRLRRADRRLAA